MKLEDIPQIRAQFQALYDAHEKARVEYVQGTGAVKRISSSHKVTALQKISEDWRRAGRNFNIGLEELTLKVFGKDIGTNDPKDVLDWIEHFVSTEDGL